MLNEANTKPASPATDISTTHLSISNLISYTLLTGAGMLAFHFAFQAALLASYPSIYEKLHNVQMVFGKMNFPIGKVSISMICILVITFNYWSHKIIMLFNIYMRLYLQSGNQIERASGYEDGVYIATLRKYEELGHVGHGKNWTVCFLVMSSLMWLVLGLLPWAS